MGSLPAAYAPTLIRSRERSNREYSCFSLRAASWCSCEVIMCSVGAYAAGSDPILDQAIAKQDQITGFLCQEIGDNEDMLKSLGQLTSLFG